MIWARMTATDPKTTVNRESTLGDTVPLDSLILYMYSYEFATVAEYVLDDKSEAEHRLKATVGTSVRFVLFNALATICLVLVLLGAHAKYVVLPALIIGYWVLVFGGYIVASKVYDSNTEIIWAQGSEIREDPDRGPRWAKRRVIAFYVANAVYFLAIIWLIF